jgi:guanidinoacetate N-methyltransferase
MEPVLKVIQERSGDHRADEQRLREELHGMYTKVGFYEPDKWKAAPATVDEHSLKILGHPVMEDWERPYMQELARIATLNGGRVLEIGYGMGISAGFISEFYDQGVTEHVIVEANHDVAALAREFRDRHRPGLVRIVEGVSYDVIEESADGVFDEGTFDGILHDAYPLEESQVQNQAHFAGTAFRLLRPGGIFTYFSDEPTGYRPEHLQMLLDAGFAREDVDHRIIDVAPPEDCLYWKRDTILAPIVRKR